MSGNPNDTHTPRNSNPGRGTAVAFVLKGYPRLSETFIAQEIAALERLGLSIVIASLRHPTDSAIHPIHHSIQAPVHYLPEYIHRAPLRVLRAWWRARRRPGYRAALLAWLGDLRHDPTPNRCRRFGQALVLSTELDGMTASGCRVSWLHAHFLHTPASVARYASLISDLPWSCSAHAKDIWTIRDWEKSEKLLSMQWLVTCTEIGRAHLAKLAPSPETVHLAYHGLDFSEPGTGPSGEPSGGDISAPGPSRLLTVGRAVEKKGIDVLLRALALLPASIDWRWEHIGRGTELPRLRGLAEELGISERVTWRGARSRDTVFAAYDAADIFILPCKVARDGDRDGLPNVLMEAMSRGLCCVSTAVGAVPELIESHKTGVLVPAESPAELAGAIAALAVDQARREALAAAGNRHVRARFDQAGGLSVLCRLFGLDGPDTAEGASVPAPRPDADRILRSA